MEQRKGVFVHIVSNSGDTDWSVPPPPSSLLQMLGVADGKWLCLIVATFTLASSFFNFQVGDDGLISKEYYSEWATGVMEVAVCCPYVALKLLEFVYNLLARQSKSRITCRPTGHQPFLWSHQPFIDTVILVVISYLILLDINWSFVWLAIFPVTAIVFIGALHLKFNNSTTAYSKVIEETNRETMEFEIIAMTLMALLFMDLLPPEYAAAGFSISQFLLFLSCTMASLTRMMMNLPTSASPGIAPASGMLHKTLIVLLLVTAHTVAAEWLGVDVVLLCLPEVIPVLLCFLLHIHRKPGSSSIINVDKMKAHMINWPGKVGAVVVAPLFAHLLLTMDESGLSGWCTAFQVSCGVSGILTRYLVFMLNHWTRQQVAAAGKEDGASVILKLWAYALLKASAASLLLWYMVSLRLGLQPPLHATAMYVGSLFGFTFNYSN